MIKKFKKGFTLVELVIVIAVIAILAAVLLPTFAGIIERARTSTRLQKVTSARDEYYSGNEEMSSPVDMAGYLLVYGDYYYEIDNNGSIVETEAMSTNYVNENYDIDYVNEIDGVTVYKPSNGVGGYVGETFYTWNELLSQNLIAVQNVNLAGTFGILAPETINDETLKLLTYIAPDVTKIKFGGEQVDGVANAFIVEDYTRMFEVYESLRFATHQTKQTAKQNFSDAFSQYQNNTLKEVVLLDGVKVLTAASFFNYTALETVVVADSVQEFGIACFFSCMNLKHLTINETSTLTACGMGVFFNCASLTEIYLPQSLNEIKGFLCYCCFDLVKITLPSTINALDTTYWNMYGDMAMFSNCVSLETIVLPSNINCLPDGMFLNCLSLSRIVIPESVVAINTYVFSDCDNLISVTFEDYDGWKVKDTDTTIDFSNAENNVELLTNTYSGNLLEKAD